LNIIVVTPVYNDWQSFQVLVHELYEISQKDGFKIERIIAVNDGSIKTLEAQKITDNIPVTVLNLNTNMGHQRAISIGLSYVEEQLSDFDCVIAMDCDGEDRPLDIKKIISKVAQEKSQTIVFAKREKRSEGVAFKLFYRLYKVIFYALTSQKLDFGNFSCIPNSLLSKVVSTPEIWNHYSGGIIKSKIPYASVGTDRGQRYQGSSKMNFQNLVLHGLSSISIYLDVVSIRLLFIAFSFAVLTAFGLFAIIYMHFFTDILIPEWYSLVVLSLINILVIVMLTTFLILLFQLNQKNSVKFPPKQFYKNFILTISNIHE
jgi:hypothetical protein